MYHLKCNMCACTDFKAIADLTLHINAHFHQFPFKCRMCASNFWDATSFVQHISKSHKEVKNAVKCPMCTKEQCSLAELQEHLLDNHKFRERTSLVSSSEEIVGPHKCAGCDRSFTHPNDLSAHMKSHSGSWVFECSLCFRTYLTKKTLVSHIVNVHKDKFRDGNGLALIDRALDKYMDEHRIPDGSKTSDGGTHCPNIFRLVASMLNADSARRFRCSTCDLFFVKQSSLEIHYRRNHPGVYETIIDVFECGICPPSSTKSLNSTEDLFNHLRKMHCAENPYKCGKCEEQTFPQQNGLEKHIEMRHGTGVVEQPSASMHLCSQCPKVFAMLDERDKHERIHTLNKPFTCDICDKTFFHHSSMRKHNLIHSGVRRFMCDICGKTLQVWIYWPYI